ncbi:MAG: amino acid racemase [bacterium]
MKTIGLIGGTYWISTAEYYKNINVGINEKLGGLNFAKCIIFSVNYNEIDECNKRGDKEGVYKIIKDAARKLILAGVDCILLCANTLHQFAERLQTEINIPFIHIAEATAKEISKAGLSTIGLLGTKQTLGMNFYKLKLADAGITTLVPPENNREIMQKIIDDELSHGIFRDESIKQFQLIMSDLGKEGAQGFVLGCTEIPLLIKQEHSPLPVFNTLEIHSQAAVDFVLK